MSRRKPMFGMSSEQEMRFFSLASQLRSLGFWVRSEPLEGNVEGWLAGIERNLSRIIEELDSINRNYNTRGRSKAARYYLTSRKYFDPGFGIQVTHDQRKENEAYAAQLTRAVARWDAEYGGEPTPPTGKT